VTNHPLLVDVSRTRKINVVCGFGALAPWDLDQLDEATIEEYDALYEYERRKKESDAVMRKNDQYLATRRASHPSYRKY